MKIDYNDIALHKPVQYVSELRWLLEKLELLQPRKTAVEIGVFKGGTFYAFMKLFDEVIGIDIEKQDFTFPLRDNDQYIIGDSKDVNIIGQVEEGIDFLFIDGDHTYRGVCDDFYLWKSKVRKGGIIALHDIKGVDYGGRIGTEVQSFWNEIKPAYNTEEVIHHDKFFGIGLIRV